MKSKNSITFVTGNAEKTADIKKMMGNKFELIFTEKIELLEIQTLSVEKVVEFKARQAFDILKVPVAVSDSGLEIVTLKNFPGALVKYANESLGQEGIVKLLEGKDDRTAYFVAAIGYCDSEGKSNVFVERDEGTIADKPKGEGWHFDRIFIPKGKNKTWAEIGRDAKNENSAFKRALEKLVKHLLEIK